MGKFAALALVAVGLAFVAVALDTPGGGKGADASLATADPAPAADGRTPVLVELFTSEGCSSCPPADALLTRLERSQPVRGAEVVPVAFHVDYWNRLGWADPFSSAQFSARQGEYARAYGKDGVYTPQMIVDGVKEFPGGNEDLAIESIARAARTPKPAVRLTRGVASVDDAPRLAVRIEGLPRTGTGDAAYALLAVTESGLSSDVRGGENAGRSLSHVGVVRRLTTLGRVEGSTFSAEAAIPVERGWRRENLRAVVFAQESGSRRVLAAGSVKLFE